MARNFSRKDIFYHGEGWYPSANASDLFVFLNSLSMDNPGLMSAAEALLKVNPGSTDFAVEARFEAALQFLNQMYLSERSKELAFIKSKLPNANVSIDMPYLEVIKLLNEAILEEKKFLTRIQQEQERSIISDKKGMGYYSYTQALGSYIEKALNQMTGQGLDESSKKDEDSLSMLVTRLLIRNINQNMSSLNFTQLATIVGITQSQLMPELKNLEKAGLLQQKRNKKKLSVTSVESAIRNSGVFQNIYKKEKSHLNELRKISNHVLSKYGRFSSENGELARGMNKITRAEQYLASLTEKPNLNKTEAVVKRIMENQQDSLGIRFDLNFKPNTGMGQEIQVYEDIKNSILSGVNGGKIDVSSIHLGEFELKYKKEAKTIKEKHNKIMSSINSDTQKNFEKVGNEFLAAYRDIEEILSRDIKNMENVSKSFIIHSNVKDYASTVKGDFNGFQGGVYQGLDLIDAIDSLSSVGFSAADTNWLKTCVLNTSQYSAGGSNKKALEEYLSIFASALLFDDGLTIAQQAANNQFSVLDVLHLFPVNGIYLPSSYVMELIHNQLKGTLSASKAKSSISTTINPGSVNFQAELDSLSSQKIFKYPRWRAISNKQIAAMSIEIRFLGNFMDIINSFGV